MNEPVVAPPPVPSGAPGSPTRKSSNKPAQPRGGRSAPPVERSRAADDRRSQHTTVYLEATARARLGEALHADPEATVADAMLGAVRSGLPQLRSTQLAEPPAIADDPLPPPPRRRRRRRVEDGRAVPVRFSRAERDALDRLGEELGLSVSGLISEALALGSGEPAPGGNRQ
ncbi:MAG: hypothetical protein ACRD1K_03400 [Acidimicrobiales bacterium]